MCLNCTVFKNSIYYVYTKINKLLSLKINKIFFNYYLKQKSKYKNKNKIKKNYFLCSDKNILPISLIVSSIGVKIIPVLSVTFLFEKNNFF